jgi:SSS family solute:Na+ symporter
VLFAVASVLIAGVNLHALGLILEALLGWPLELAIPIAAPVVLSYTFFGGSAPPSTTRCCSSS